MIYFKLNLFNFFCLFQLISKLAVVIFTALDHGLQDEEERHLSPDLVALLDAMAAAGWFITFQYIF